MLRKKRTVWGNLSFPNGTLLTVPASMSALKGARARAHARACLTSYEIFRSNQTNFFVSFAPNDTP